MMRNQNFQHSLFLDMDIEEWPKEDSQYPRDLIQLWEDHSFIFKFIQNLTSLSHLSNQHPTFQFDWIYQEIFTRHPDTLLVLRNIMLDYPIFLNFGHILELYGMTYRIFEPFARFQQFLQFPFPEGDSPLDFLMDPIRAGVLYRNPEDIAEDFILLWIYRAKELLEGQSDFPLWGYQLQGIHKCRPSSRLLRELESLNFVPLCNELAPDTEAHENLHDRFLQAEYLRPIVHWLWKFPNPPVEAIAFWDQQIADLEQCIDDHGFSLRFPGY
ncbi:hypothetical protein DFH07DRAFT_21458 [Mycena maculata]|uniref:Uncharacterized protein n=1 Tax=Mycena maculata TaxID=230809 RepID=A0AAD7N3F4_9AGAR|nr:hypothetical protein DFH07DRAFT_21458 [Mycena maculata]